MSEPSDKLPAKQQSPADLFLDWQKKCLQSVLVIHSIFGFTLAILDLLNILVNPFSWIQISILVISTAFIGLFLLSKISFNFRVYFTLFLAFTFSNILFVQFGWRSVSLFSLLVFSLLCSIFLKTRPMIFFSGLALLTLALWSNFSYVGFLHERTLPLPIELIAVVLFGFFANLVVILLRKKINLNIEEYVQTKNMLFELETSLNQAMKENQHALAFAKTISEITRILKTSPDIHSSLKQTADLIAERNDLAFVGIFLLDQSADYVVLHYGTGDAGRRMINSSYRLALAGSSLVSACIRENKILETGKSAELEINRQIENPFLPDSQMELVIPLCRGNEVLGAVNILSTHPTLDSDLRKHLLEVTSLISLTLGKTSILQPIKSFHKPEPLMTPSQRILEYTYEKTDLVKTIEPKSLVEIPLMAGDTKIGCVEMEVPGNGLSQDQKVFLNEMSSQLITALQNRTSLDQSIRQVERETKILDITSKIRVTNDSQKMIRIALEELSQALGVSKAQIVLNVPEKPLEQDSETETKTFSRKRTTGELRER